MIIKKKTIVKKLFNIFKPIYLLSSIFNILWVVTFSYEIIGISKVLIFRLLISLTKINKKLVENRREISYWLTSITFGLYAGWLTIATVVNISAFLVSIEWNGLGISPATWVPVILFILCRLHGHTLEYLMNLIERVINQTMLNIKQVIGFGIIAILIASIIQFKRNNYCVIKKEKK